MRTENVKKEFEALDLAAFVTDDPYHFLYLTGLFPSSGRLLLTKDEMVLFLDGRYASEAKESVPFEVVEAKELDVALMGRLPKEGKVGFSDAKSSYGKVKKWLESGAEMVPSRDPIAKAREIKESSELVLMRAAAEMAVKGHQFLERTIKEGISEKELASRLEIFWLENGGHHPSFPPIIAFGKATAFPHYHPKHHRFQMGDGVQIDLGVEVEHYQSDLSRYHLPLGESPLYEICALVKEAQESVLKEIKPGVSLKYLDEIARGVIEKGGFGDRFTHSLGHGIGLEVHEEPYLRETTPPEIVAKTGMCFTVEPGIYIPGLGGVRLEETILVTKTGYEVITR